MCPHFLPYYYLCYIIWIMDVPIIRSKNYLEIENLELFPYFLQPCISVAGKSLASVIVFFE